MQGKEKGRETQINTCVKSICSDIEEVREVFFQLKSSVVICHEQREKQGAD